MMMNLPEVMKGQKKPRIVRFKPIKQSRQTELWYSRQLVSRVKWLREQIERALQNKQGPFFMDSDFDVFNTEQLLSVIKKLSEKDRSNEIESLANEFVSRGNVQNQREVGENLKRQTGIDLQAFLNQNTAVLNKMSVMTTANVQLIKSIEQQYLDKVQTIITQGAISGKLNRDLAKEIRDLGGVTENRAKFIARDQSSKINAALTQARHEELGIKKYRWSTSGDERVRDSHAENDGKIFSYDQPPETGHPGQDFNCRCVAIPVLDDLPTDKEKEPSELSQKTEEILPKELPEVINIGKKLHTKYSDVLDQAIKSGKPYVGVMEIMRREGVELGGKVSVASLDKRAATEMTEVAKRYPKSWVEKSNQAAGLVVKEAKKRAFQMKIPQEWDLEKLKNGRVKWGRYKPLETSIKKGLIKNGDSFILSNTSHSERIRLSRFIHEYAHKLQSENPDLNQYFVDFWIKRTANKPYIKYNGEIIKDGGFIHPYYGRDYSGDPKNPKPLEMMSMTFEALLGDDPSNDLATLRERDPELFNLGIALLTRYKK